MKYSRKSASNTLYNTFHILERKSNITKAVMKNNKE